MPLLRGGFNNMTQVLFFFGKPNYLVLTPFWLNPFGGPLLLASWCLT